MCSQKSGHLVWPPFRPNREHVAKSAMFRRDGDCSGCVLKALRTTHYALRTTHYALRTTHYALRTTYQAIRTGVSGMVSSVHSQPALVLVVDADPANQRTMRDKLLRLGYAARSADDHQSAVAIIAAT